MKSIVALLSVLLLSACAHKPKADPVEQTAKLAGLKEKQPPCFAPAGAYMAVFSLVKHDCKLQPKQTILAPFFVEEGSIPCGTARDTSVLKDGTTVTTIQVATARGISSMVVVRPPDKSCAALYEGVFVRLK